MYKTKYTARCYTVRFLGTYTLPQEVSVILDKPPAFDQMKKFLIHLKDKAVGCSTNQNFSPFYQAIYRSMADALMAMYNDLACSGKLLRTYTCGHFSLECNIIHIKGFGR